MSTPEDNFANMTLAIGNAVERLQTMESSFRVWAQLAQDEDQHLGFLQAAEIYRSSWVHLELSFKEVVRDIQPGLVERAEEAAEKVHDHMMRRGNAESN